MYSPTHDGDPEMSTHTQKLKSKLAQDQLTPNSEQPGDIPSFDLGDHPSEVMARRAVWAWMRSYWARRLKQRNRHVQSVREETRDTSIGVKA